MVVPQVCFILSSLSGGGAEKSISTVHESLKSMGFPSILIGINQDPTPERFETNSSHISLGRKWRSGIITWCVALYRLRLILKRHVIDTVVLNGELAESLGTFLPRTTRLVVVEHSGFAWNRFPLLGKWIRHQIKRREAIWVAVSNNLNVRGIPESKIKRIPNPISIEQDDDNGCRKNLQSKRDPRVVFVGRLVPEKDPLLFLEISKASQMKSLLIGNGPLLHQIMKLGYSDTEFLGFVQNPWDFIEKEDLILCTSVFEGDGMAIAEAIMRGCPLLVRRFAGYERFCLPTVNTFSTRDEAVQIIKDHRGNFGELKAPEETTIFEIRNRDPKRIAALWKQLLIQG